MRVSPDQFPSLLLISRHLLNAFCQLRIRNLKKQNRLIASGFLRNTAPLEATMEDHDRFFNLLNFIL